MEGYRTFHEALDQAVRAVHKWKDAETGETIDFLDLHQAADFLDEHAPLEDYFYYAVFPDGEIDLLNTADQTITRLYEASPEGGAKE